MSITSSFEPYNYHYTLLNRIKSNLGIYPEVYVQSFRHEKFHVSRHLTAQHIKNQLRELNGNDNLFNNYYKFSFVRNPYEILVSGYEYVKSSINPNHPGHQDENFIWMRNNFRNFKDYVIEFRMRHFPNYQHDYLFDNEGNCLVDFIGKTESIDKDINMICDRLSIPTSKVPHLNKTNRKSFENYFDNEIIEVVNEFYNKDFELLGYKKVE